MGIACKIHSNYVEAANGNRSQLFDDAMSYTNDRQKALDIYSVIHTEQYKEERLVPTIQRYRNSISNLFGENTLSTIAGIKPDEVRVNNFRTFTVGLEDRNIARLRTFKFEDGYKIESSLVAPEYRGQGLGSSLYNSTILKLISEGQNIYSDDSLTEDSQRIWDKLYSQGIAEKTRSGYVIRAYPKSLDRNKEPKLQEVLKYIGDYSRQNKSLSFRQLQDVKNAMIGSPNLREQVTEAFYKDGVFSIEKQNLLNSGLYSLPEANNIISNKELQDEIKSTIEAYLSSEVEEIAAQIEIEPKEKPSTPKQMVTAIINRLKKTGLAARTYVLSNSQIQDKLRSIGVNPNVLMQIENEEGSIEEAIKLNNRYPMHQTPQGRESKLFNSLLKEVGGDRNKASLLKSKVYSKNFKNWFGDWQTDLNNSSKIVDENGEPLLVYHGTPVGNFNEFDIKNKNKSSGLREYGNFFTTSKPLARVYTSDRLLTEEQKNKRNEEAAVVEDLAMRSRNSRDFERYNSIADDIKYGKIYSTFLNIRDIKIFDAKGEAGLEAWNSLKVNAGYDIKTNKEAIEFLYRGLNTESKQGRPEPIFVGGGVELKPVDGIKAENIIDLNQMPKYEWQQQPFRGDVFIAFDAQNIKSIFNEGDFSSSNNDIRYSKDLIITPKGFVYKDEVYLNEEKMTLDTSIHEFGHLWNQYTKNLSPELYNKGIDLIKKEGKEYIDYVKANQPNLKGEALLEESLAQAIGDRGAKIVNSRRKGKISEWLNDLWSFIKNSLGLSQYTNEQVQNMNLNEYTEAVAIDLLSGENLKGKNSNETSAIGTFKNLNPFIQEKRIVELLGGIKDREFFESKLSDSNFSQLKEKYFNNKDFADTLFNQMSSLSRLKEFKLSEDNLQRRTKTETKEKLEETLLTDVDNSLNQDIVYLQSLPNDIWRNNPEDISAILESIRENAVEYGVDLSELENRYVENTQEEILDLLIPFKNLNLQPNERFMNDFVKAYDSFYSVDKSGEVKIENIKPEHREKTLIYLDTDLSEYELFNKHSLLKVQDKVYQKINKESNIDVLINQFTQSLIDGNSPTSVQLSNKDNFEKSQQEVISFVQDRVANLEIPKTNVDIEELQKMVMYKDYFGLDFTSVKPVDKEVELQKFRNFEGDSEYLSTEFVADFQKEYIKEKQKNSSEFNEFFNHFSVSSRGIVLRNNDPISREQIKDYLSENSPLDSKFKNNFKQYTILSKSMDFTEVLDTNDFTQTDDFLRDFYVNNPESAQKVQGQYTKVRENTIVAERNPQFVRTSEGVYEATDSLGDKTFYTKLPLPSSNYNKYGTERPDLDVNIYDYAHLISKPENSIKDRKYYSQEELESINEERFSCQQ